MINAFVFDDYALRKMARHELTTVLLDDGAGLTPTQRMIVKLGQMTPLPPPGDEQFRLARMIRAERSLQKYGIEYETLHYSSDELRTLYHEIGPSFKSKTAPDKLEIYVDPFDVRSIHVVHPMTKKRLVANLKHELPFAMTLEHFKESRDYARQYFKSESDKAITHAFHMRTMDAVEQLERPGKVKRTEKAVTRKTAAFIGKAKSAFEQPALEKKDLTLDFSLPLSPMPTPLFVESSAVPFTPVQRRARPAK